jgi:hypothetical protein
MSDRKEDETQQQANAKVKDPGSYVRSQKVKVRNILCLNAILWRMVMGVYMRV